MTARAPAQPLRSPGPPRGIIHADAPPDGILDHRRVPPPPELAPFVAHFWTVTYSLRAAFVARTLPHPTTHVLFEADTAGARAEVAFPHTARFERRLEGTGATFAVKLRPAMAGAFSPLHAAHAARLRGRVVPLDALFGEGSGAAARAIFALAPDDLEGRLARGAELLLGCRPVATAELVFVRDLVERIAEDSTLRTVADVARAAGLTVRALQRLFAALVGLTPKWVLQRYRLHEAAARLDGGTPPGLADLAAELGYADQAHFTRDFRRVVGCPPGAYAAFAERRRRHRTAPLGHDDRQDQGARAGLSGRGCSAPDRPLGPRSPPAGGSTRR